MRETLGTLTAVKYVFLCVSIGFTFLIFEGCGYHAGESSELREAELPADKEETSSQESDETAPGHIYVYVCGEVCAPGVYELPADSRMYEAIEAAGGMTEAASAETLNQAEKLSDGQKINVLSVEEEEAQSKEAGEVQEASDGRVNLNTAAKEELMTLPGIGEVKAEAIIRYREEAGGFTSIEELKEIEGIKDGVFNKVKDRIKVS